MRETIFRRNGINKKEKEIMFPGYVFVETAIESRDFLQTMFNFIHSHSNKAIRILQYGNSGAAINKDEMRFLQHLLGDKRCIETSIGFKEGDKVIVEHGPLIGCESIIKRVNQRRREAMIEIDIMGDKREIKVAFEILKIEDSYNNL
jgi:transcriptional antiterminator NusG